MPLAYLVGKDRNDTPAVVMYDTCTEYAFGPLFASEKEIDDFCDFLLRTYGECDPRGLTTYQLERAHEKWIKEVAERPDPLPNL